MVDVSGNPYWILDEQRRRRGRYQGSLGREVVDRLGTALGVWGACLGLAAMTNAPLESMPALAMPFMVLICVAWVLTVALHRGWNVIARERGGRRFEAVRVTSMPAATMLRGLLAQALRPTLIDWGCSSAWLLVALPLGGASVCGTVAIVALTLVLACLLTVVALSAAGRTPTEDLGSGAGALGSTLLMGLVLLVVFHVCLGAIDVAAITGLDPFVFYWHTVHIEHESLATVLSWLLPPVVLYATVAMAWWRYTVSNWFRYEVMTPTTPTVLTLPPRPASSSRLRTYQKPPWLRQAVVADAWNRLRRTNPLGGIGNLLWAAYLALLPGGVHTSSTPWLWLICFFLWGTYKASQVADRERDQTQLELLLITPQSGGALLRSQMVASLLPILAPLLVFEVIGAGKVLSSWDRGSTLGIALMTVWLVPIVGVLAGLGLALGSRYRIRFRLVHGARTTQDRAPSTAMR